MCVSLPVKDAFVGIGNLVQAAFRKRSDDVAVPAKDEQ